MAEEELEQPLLAEGWVADEVREEFPDLRLRTMAVPRGTGRTPDFVRQRLSLLSDRFRGAQAIVLRRAPVPSAYRVFFRHVGLDPDTTRTPAEEAAMQRLIAGGFRATNLLDDALLIALLETDVPLWALDAATVREPLGIGAAGDGRLWVLRRRRAAERRCSATSRTTGASTKRHDPDARLHDPGPRRARHLRRGGLLDRPWSPSGRKLD